MTLGAYKTHFRFRFGSPNGTEFLINMKQLGYEGIPLQRSLGQSPVLKREQNGHIWGTSLEIYAECAVDEEFADLYTSSPFEWMVELEQSDGIGGSVIWRGYVVPELYSEPDIAPPYDVQIIATDNLGELKFKNVTEESFEDASSLQDVLTEILGETQLGILDGRMLSTLRIATESGTSADIPPLALSWEGIRDVYTQDDKTYYDVLQDILAFLGCFLYLASNLQWMLIRELDCQMDIWGSSFANLKSLSSGSSLPTLADDIITLGSDSSWWPVGSLTSTVEPAKKSVTISETPYYREDLIADPEMDADYPNDFWHYVGAARRAELGGERGYVLGRRSQNLSGATVSEGRLVCYPVSIPRTTGKKLVLEVKVRTYVNAFDNPAVYALASTKDRWLYMHVILNASSGQTFYLTHATWDEDPQYRWASETVGAVRLKYQLPEAQMAQGSDLLPASPDTQIMTITLPIATDTPEGVLVVEMFNKSGQSSDNFDDYIGGSIMVCGCKLALDAESKMKQSICMVNIDNGARTSAAEEVLMAQAGASVDESFRYDIIKTPSGRSISEISCNDFSASRLLEFVAMDRAFTVALPRMRMKGTLNVPKGKWMPVIFRRRSVDYILQTYTWKLAEDEVEIDALSVPAASITIDDLTVITKEA